MAAAKRVLVTGSAGAIGQLVVNELSLHGHAVRGLDRRPSPGVAEDFVGDISDPAVVDRAVQGVDAVVHLAATPDEADFMSMLLQPNVVGLFVVCDAARRHNIPRLVLTSSIQAVWGLLKKGVRPIRVAHGVCPMNHYGLTKVWAEQMGEMYARMHGMSVIVVRPGWMVRNAQESASMGKSKRGVLVYLSPHDCGVFFRLAVEAQRPRPGECEILFAVSRSQGAQVIDLDDAKEVIGYVPAHQWPEGAPR